MIGEQFAFVFYLVKTNDGPVPSSSSNCPTSFLSNVFSSFLLDLCLILPVRPPRLKQKQKLSVKAVAIARMTRMNMHLHHVSDPLPGRAFAATVAAHQTLVQSPFRYIRSPGAADHEPHDDKLSLAMLREDACSRIGGLLAPERWTTWRVQVKDCPWQATTFSYTTNST